MLFQLSKYSEFKLAKYSEFKLSKYSEFKLAKYSEFQLAKYSQLRASVLDASVRRSKFKRKIVNTKFVFHRSSSFW